MRFLILPLALAVSLPTLAAGPTGLLNDTGQADCQDDSAVAACATVATDGGTHPRQDARFGRDAKAAAGKLVKTGGGAAGFDFTKVCWNGDLEGSGTCTGALVANTSSTASGTPGTDWACTKDNLTNLIWSLETVSGVWLDATTTHPAAANAAGRCGFATGWRAPTRRELLSIVNFGAPSPAIDGNYFPATLATCCYWTSDVYAPTPTRAWRIDFANGQISWFSKTFAMSVRLVHSGP
jgi:hypothetical protein